MIEKLKKSKSKKNQKFEIIRKKSLEEADENTTVEEK